MPLKPTTRAQVDGHRFLARRARHAVVARDVRMLHDPLKRQATGLTVGAVAAVIGCAGIAILALLSPAPDVARASVMVGRDSGQMYVRAGEVVHPVLNLASARLVLGEPAEPVTVRDTDLAGTRRGGLLGIPGAPSVLPPQRDEATAATISAFPPRPVAGSTSGHHRDQVAGHRFDLALGGVRSIRVRDIQGKPALDKFLPLTNTSRYR